jgi:creatinine amidohydrolase
MRSRHMPELTNLEVREFLDGGGRTVIVPVGSTEDHGDHAPLWTDVYIPQEVALRAAPELDALVGPPVPFGLASDHRGAPRLAYLRLETFTAGAARRDRNARRGGVPADRPPERAPREHVGDAVRGFAHELPEGTPVYPFADWLGLPPERAARYPGPGVGIHANVGETSAVLAIDPEPRRVERARDFAPVDVVHDMDRVHDALDR